MLSPQSNATISTFKAKSSNRFQTDILETFFAVFTNRPDLTLRY